MRAEIDGDVIHVAAGPRDTYRVKQVPGARFRAREARWVAPVSWAACVALRGVFGDDLEVGPTLAEWARDELAHRVQPALTWRDQLDTDVQNLDGLYGFQKTGALFLCTAKQAILADDMGTGKTVQTIAALRRLGGIPALVVCPNSMKLTWLDELERWAPELQAVVIRGGAGERRKAIAQVAAGMADVAIINWEALRSHTALAGYYSVVHVTDAEKEPKELNEIPWVTVVADEAHRAKDPRAKQTRALWRVSRDATYRFALTGTPVLNSPEDLWSLGHFVAPDEWPVKTAYLERYAMTGWNPFGGLEIIGLREDTKRELFAFLDPRFLRRTKEVVLPQLPAKQYARRVVELPTKQRRAYNAMRDEMLAELEDGITYVTNAMSKLLRLRQFAAAYAVVDGTKRLHLAAPSCKVDALAEISEELSRPAVVFAESRQLIELAAHKLAGVKFDESARTADWYTQLYAAGVGLITGGESDTERAAAMEQFQRGDLRLMLCTLGAGGEGITLTRADTVIFLQRSFSLAKNRQAEDRVHRIGQEAEAVTVIDIVAADTVEARVEVALAEKAELFEEVVRDAETFRRLLGGDA